LALPQWGIASANLRGASATSGHELPAARSEAGIILAQGPETPEQRRARELQKAKQAPPVQKSGPPPQVPGQRPAGPTVQPQGAPPIQNVQPRTVPNVQPRAPAVAQPAGQPTPQGAREVDPRNLPKNVQPKNVQPKAGPV